MNVLRTALSKRSASVLPGKRSLHKYFQPDTAISGQEALASIKRDGPYAVVVSDMRMPGSDADRT